MLYLWFDKFFIYFLSFAHLKIEDSRIVSYVRLKCKLLDSIICNVNGGDPIFHKLRNGTGTCKKITYKQKLIQELCNKSGTDGIQSVTTGYFNLHELNGQVSTTILQIKLSMITQKNKGILEWLTTNPPLKHDKAFIWFEFKCMPTSL